MLKKSICIFVFFCSALYGQSSDIGKQYQQPVQLLSDIEESGLVHNHDLMVELFTSLNTGSYELLKQLRKDIGILKASLKKKRDVQVQLLCDQLQRLVLYVKKNKINNDAILFHQMLQKKYQELLELIEQGQDVIEHIDKNRNMFDLQQSDKKYLKTFLRDLASVRNRISEFEDYIHADFIDLKLMNYVFKIEFIKLRNAILFDQRYKDMKKG